MIKKTFKHTLSKEIEALFQDIKNLFSLLLEKGIEAFYALQNSKFATEYNASVFFMFRNFLSVVDGIIAVIDACSEESLEIMLRCILEYNACLKYLLAEDTQNRALAYQVCYAIEKLKLYKKYDTNTGEGKAFKQLWQKDEIAKRLPFPDSDSVENSKFLLKMLDREPFLSIKKEYNRTKKHINRRPEWYSLWSGPKNIQELFFFLEMPVTYEVYYRQWSGNIHPVGAFRNIAQNQAGGGIAFLGNPENIPDLCQLGINFVIDVLQTIYNTILKNEKKAFIEFYKNQVLPLKVSIENTKIVINETKII